MPPRQFSCQRNRPNASSRVDPKARPDRGAYEVILGRRESSSPVTHQDDVDHLGSWKQRHSCHRARRDPMAKGAGEPANKALEDIRRKTRRMSSAEEKIRIVLERSREEE